MSNKYICSKEWKHYIIRLCPMSQGNIRQWNGFIRLSMYHPSVVYQFYHTKQNVFLHLIGLLYISNNKSQMSLIIQIFMYLYPCIIEAYYYFPSSRLFESVISFTFEAVLLVEFLETQVYLSTWVELWTHLESHIAFFEKKKRVY